MKKSFAYFANALKAGEELGIETMAINSGWGYWNEDREEAWKRSREMLSRLADEAAKHNINLAMESLRPQESQLVVTLADAKRMHDEVNHPNLKVMIDTTAMGVAGETIDEWFDTLAMRYSYAFHRWKSIRTSDLGRWQSSTWRMD